MSVFGIRPFIGSTDSRWVQVDSYTAPVTVESVQSAGGAYHVTRSVHLKSILQRGLRGGGFGTTRATDLQLQPFAPWDRRGSAVRGREGWDNDLCICLDRTQLAASGELRCTPNGFLVTRATVPVSCILWIMAWVDGAWHTIFDKRAAKYPITGTVGGDKDLGLHPDVLANQRCAELDREAAVLEEIGRATSEPPPPRKEGEPSGAGDWYSPYLRRSLHGRRTFGWDFRRRELDRAVFDKPAGWKDSVVRHCSACGEWVPVEATRCQARCKALFLYGGSLHTLPQPAALALEAPLSKAVAAPSQDAEVAARMLQYKTSGAASYRSEFKRAVRTAVKNRAKFQTYDAQRVLDFTRDGRHWLWNKKGAFNSFEAPSWDTDIPRHAWKDDDELSCFLPVRLRGHL